MRVLFFNHTGLVSGAERSMLDLVAGLAGSRVDVMVASPDGPLRDHVARLGVDHRVVPGTSGSFKLSPTGTPRALWEMVRAAVALRRLAASCRADVVHANSIRAGLIAGLARRLHGPPVIVHARDALEEGLTATAVRRVLAASVTHVIAISSFVERSLALPGGRTRVTVLHNPVDLSRFDPSRVDRRSARQLLGATGDEPLLGVLAQITPWKGQDDAIRALARLKTELPGARLLLIGEVKFIDKAVRFDNQAFRERLSALARELGVLESVGFLGEREDVPEVLAGLDLVLVPSWQEPFGRSVIEGMAMGRAVLATAVGGTSEIITDGVDGRLLPPRRPEAWAAAAREILSDDVVRANLEEAARIAAARFDRNAYVERVQALYKDIGPG